MKRMPPSPLINRLTVLATMMVAVVGMACLAADDRKAGDLTLAPKIHPLVFGLVTGWNSDGESPVVLEFNLDALEKNRNQFDRDKVRQEDGWTVFREAGSKAFNRYRVVEARGSHYKVEYQENGGGTHTTAAMIEYSVGTREIRKEGRLTVVRVLRVEGFSSR